MAGLFMSCMRSGSEHRGACSTISCCAGRYGAYEPIKQMLDGEHPAGGLPADVPLWKKIAAGGAAGALGAAGATPSDLIKVRMQAAMRQADAAVGSQARRLPPTGIWQAASAIYR